MKIVFMLIVFATGMTGDALAQQGQQNGEVAASQIARGKIVRLPEGTPLRSGQTVLHIAKRQDEFVVLDVRNGREVYVSVVQNSGGEIAAVVPLSAASINDKSPKELAGIIEDAMSNRRYAAALAVASAWHARREELLAIIERIRSADITLATATQETAAAQADHNRTLRHAELTRGQGGNAGFSRVADAAIQKSEARISFAQEAQKVGAVERETAVVAMRELLGTRVPVAAVPAPPHQPKDGLVGDIPEQFLDRGISPSYQETLAFLNAKIGVRGQKLWFEKGSGKMHFTNVGEVCVFDPAILNSDLLIGRRPWAGRYIHFVRAECRGAQKLIHARLRSKREVLISGMTFDLTNEVDAERVAKALRHLIEMFGGEPDPF